MSNEPILDELETPTWRKMGRAIRYLSERYQDQPDLEEAASVAGLSPYHFQRLFTRYVGVSPKAFVSHLTLGHAKADLEQGASVLNAALDAGLSGPSRLHDLCLKIEAMTPGDYAKGGDGLMIEYGFHDCPFGIALVMATQKGVCGLAFGDEGEEDDMLADMQCRWPKARYREAVAHTAPITRKIFAVDAKKSEEVKLHLLGTAWQIKVWQALLEIPSGSVTTYRNVASQVCSPKASRAVGAAVGRNPISLLIPCHRVLGTGGALHGYHWGLPRKRAMLAVEAAKRNQDQSERPNTSPIA
ncbi:MAG TPA: methylated-DNA--[protein]-cysteine S-methyltransferase [Rhizomicrobium sp.]|jgi:AraC family transcriptional regulator of adaptative response/methylated-DNA-[protein]-cysteine methyltransferase